jgi:diguanylate cyclase (GGDEF)-like protein
MKLATSPRPLPLAEGRGGRPASATRALADLDGRQADLLLSLQDPESLHAEMLTALMISNSLLELSRLASARLSLLEFARATLTTIAQCAPLDGAALVFTVPDIPPVNCTTGDWTDPQTDGESTVFQREDTASSPVFGQEVATPIGYLALVGAPDKVVEAGLVTRASEQISSMLGMLIEAERLRRAAASAKAMELVGAVGDEYGEAELAEIVSTMQTLPGAEAASLLVEIPRFGGPLLAEAGDVDLETSHTERVDTLDRNASITLRMWWTGGTPPTDTRVDDIADRLKASIMRAEQTWLLRAEVETDELTRIGNRRRGSRALAQASARARRSGEEYAMFMMDLDKFKSVNDEFGHEAGDEVLKLFAQAIESVVRGYDVAARWGGEEFLLVCPGTGRDGAQALARRLLEKTPVMCSAALPPERLQTVSIGIAVCENPAIDPMTLLRQADQAMYAAKTTGRNRFVLADAQPR